MKPYSVQTFPQNRYSLVNSDSIREYLEGRQGAFYLWLCALGNLHVILLFRVECAANLYEKDHFRVAILYETYAQTLLDVWTYV